MFWVTLIGAVKEKSLDNTIELIILISQGRFKMYQSVPLKSALSCDHSSLLVNGRLNYHLF